jgi:hypothetical protein
MAVSSRTSGAGHEADAALLAAAPAQTQLSGPPSAGQPGSGKEQQLAKLVDQLKERLRVSEQHVGISLGIGNVLGDAGNVPSVEKSRQKGSRMEYPNYCQPVVGHCHWPALDPSWCALDPLQVSKVESEQLEDMLAQAEARCERERALVSQLQGEVTALAEGKRRAETVLQAEVSKQVCGLPGLVMYSCLGPVLVLLTTAHQLIILKAVVLQ